MPKQKAFLKETRESKNKKRKDAPSLETADDYQAAGVDFEEAAGKHRAGDAVKSLRFFQRALDVYDDGLRRFPQSFDLAYNKARVQYEVTTHPKLMKQLESPISTLLETALTSHEYSLTLDPNDPDLLFNTSQVLTSIAEEICKKGHRPKQDALSMLEKALELQDRCLSVQEMRYQQGEAQHRAAMEQQTTVQPDETIDDAPAADSTSQATPGEGQWASVIEPITIESLVDTILAQIGTATTLCSILASSYTEFPPSTFDPVEKLSSKYMEKLDTFIITNPGKQCECLLAKVNLVSVLLETRYLLGVTHYKPYKDELKTAFKNTSDTSPAELIAKATAHISFQSALDEREPGHLDHEEVDSMRRNAITEAMSSLAKASKIETISPEDLVKTHFLRGDASMIQYQVSKPRPHSQSSIDNHLHQNAPQLLKNAEVYWRNAAKLTDDSDEKDASTLRSQVAAKLRSDGKIAFGAGGKLVDVNVQGRSQDWHLAQLEEMASDGLLAEGMGQSYQ